MLRRLSNDDVLQTSDGRVDVFARVHAPESGGGRDLIVPAAAGVQFRRDVTNLGVQQPVDHRVNVFVGRNRCLSARESLRDGIQTGFNATAFLQRENPRIPERDRPRLGEADVERPEPEIGSDRPIHRLERRGRAAAEPPAPQLVRC